MLNPSYESFSNEKKSVKQTLSPDQELEISLAPSNENVHTVESQCQGQNRIQDFLDLNIPFTQISFLALSLYCSLLLGITLIVFFLVGLPLIIEEAIRNHSV